MTAAVLPAVTSFSSMSLGGSDRVDHYYPPTHLPHIVDQHEAQAAQYYGQKAQDFRYSDAASIGTNARALPPALAPILAAPYSSSPNSSGPPPSYQRAHYGPITNHGGQATPSHAMYMEAHAAYAHPPPPGSAYPSGGTPESVGSGNMMRPPQYAQHSPISTLPSPSVYGRSAYTWPPVYNGVQSQQQNYVHQALPHSARTSFSLASATTPTYPARFSHPPTPQSARDPHGPMYAQLPSSIPHISIPRQQPQVPAFQSPTQTGRKTSHGTTPPGNSGNVAAPGPIPATVPEIMKDEDGIQRIVFEYSKDKHRTKYRIRCDTNTVNVDELPTEFKEANLVYPRAYRKENYGGNRYSYESDCNNIGWALTHLNPELRENRGATQRAVDSWRNSSADPKMRSRRVRRQAKQSKRTVMAQQTQSSTASAFAGKTVDMLAMQRPLHDPLGKDSHQYQLPSMKSEEELKDVATHPTTTALSPPDPRGYQAAHIQQPHYMPQDEHGGMVHQTYHATQEYGHQATHPQAEYGAPQYAPQVGATHYGAYTGGSG